MRNDASNLNLHLQQHHLSDRPSCPFCNDTCESPSHYFMHCPLYNVHRQQLVDSFNKLNIAFTIQTILYPDVTFGHVTSGSHATFGHELWYSLYYYYCKKESAGMHFRACAEHTFCYDITSGHVTSCDVISGQGRFGGHHFQ
jgi:hypothetical protein